MLISNRAQTSSPSDVMKIGFDRDDHKSERSTVSSDSKPIELSSCQQQNDDVPFFIMDWLDQVDPLAVELAQRILRSPQRKTSDVALGSCNTMHRPVSLLDLLSPKHKHQNDLSLSQNSSSVWKPLSKNMFHTFQQRSIATGNGYNAKGITKARQGRWVDALSCWENALEIRSQIASSPPNDGDIPQDSPNQLLLDVANTQNNIGIALGKLNRTDEAVASLQIALAIRQQEYRYSDSGRGHPEIAATLHNLGNVFQQAGDFLRAIDYFGECRYYQELWHGTVTHVEVARACLAMGHTYHQAGEFHDAQAAYHDALQIFAQVGLSKDDPEVRATWEDVRDLEAELQQHHGQGDCGMKE